MAKKAFLDSVDVPDPCSQSWDEMTGDEKQRFCASCEKDIHNISAMTPREARKLLFESKEKVCIRIEKDADGKIKTLKRQIHQITRRAPVAAGVLSASLTFSALTYAQGKPVVGKMKPIVSAGHKDGQTAATISGTITDASGALVPNVVINLRNIKNDTVRNATSNNKGFYEFNSVAAAVYRIEIKIPGFKILFETINVSNDENLQLPIVLYASTSSLYHSATQETLEITSETQSVNDKIEPRQVENLPLPKGRVFVLGLFPGVAQKPQKKVSAKQQNETSQISFTVYDPNNAVIAGAQIKLTNRKTREEFTVLTDEEGNAYLSLIPRGKYDLETSANGFRSGERAIQIKEQIEPNVKITLEVGAPICIIDVN